MDSYHFKTLRPRQHGRHFTDDTFKRIFLNENVIISIKISLKFVPKGPIKNIPVLVQIMAWRRPGDKLFSEAMMTSLLTHICVTRPQWVKQKLMKILVVAVDPQFDLQLAPSVWVSMVPRAFLRDWHSVCAAESDWLFLEQDRKSQVYIALATWVCSECCLYRQEYYSAKKEENN